MCQEGDIDENDLGNSLAAREMLLELHSRSLDKFRNGVETTSQTYTANKPSDQAGKAADVKSTRRLHESWNHYDRCFNRERNKGTARHWTFRSGGQTQG